MHPKRFATNRPTAIQERRNAEERRHAARSGTHGRATYLDRFGRKIGVELIDLSEDGVGVWCGEPAECGSPATVALPAKRTSRRIQIGATIIESTVAAPGVWRVGFRFERRLDALELASALP